MKKEDMQQIPKVNTAAWKTAGLVIAALLVLCVPATLFLYHRHNKSIERRNYNEQLLREYKQEYSPEVTSIMAAASIDEMIAKIREKIREEEDGFAQAKLREREYFDDLPEDIKQRHFDTHEEAFKFYFSAVKKIMYDLENDTELDARVKEKEFAAIKYYFELYSHYSRIAYLEDLILSLKQNRDAQ